MLLLGVRDEIKSSFDDAFRTTTKTAVFVGSMDLLAGRVRIGEGLRGEE